MKAATVSLRDRIRTQLADLRMPGALEALDDVLQEVDGGKLPGPVAIERLLGAQIALRNDRRLAAAMRSSRLPAVKMLSDFDFSFQPSLKREQIDSLHTLGFVERRENVILLGPPGVGKSHLAISLAIAAAHPGGSDHLSRGSPGGRTTLPTAQDPHFPECPRGRRDRLPPDQSDRGHALLPADVAALRARQQRAHLEQELRGVG